MGLTMLIAKPIVSEAVRTAQIPFVSEMLAGARRGGVLDINEYLVRHPVASFFFRVEGDAMQGAHIFSGDILVVDRSIAPQRGHVVLAFVDGECLLRRLSEGARGFVLEAASPGYASLSAESGEGWQIWGVVVGQFRRLMP